MKTNFLAVVVLSLVFFPFVLTPNGFTAKPAPAEILNQLNQQIRDAGIVYYNKILPRNASERVKGLVETLEVFLQKPMVGVGVSPALYGWNILTIDGKELEAVEAIIDLVFSDSPAERAGLKRGDVITQVNGKYFLWLDDLVREMTSDARVGSVISLSVIRNEGGGEEKLMSVVMSKVAYGIPTKKRADAKERRKVIEKYGKEFVDVITKRSHEVAEKLASGSDVGDEELAPIKNAVKSFNVWLSVQKQLIATLIEPL